MEVILGDTEREALEKRCQGERGIRQWRRYRAILLLADQWSVPAIAEALGCCPNSVWNWSARWRELGIAGLGEGHHLGRTPLLDEAAGKQLDELLDQDPQGHGYQSTGWTVPLLTTELTSRGYQISAHTVRRTLRRRQWRWKRPKYVLGRRDPEYEEKRGS